MYIYIYIFYIYVYIYSKIARCEICIVCNYIARCKVIQYLQESASFYELKNQREFILFKVSNTKTRIDCKIVMKRLSEHQKEVIRAVFIYLSSVSWNSVVELGHILVYGNVIATSEISMNRIFQSQQ